MRDEGEENTEEDTPRLVHVDLLPGDLVEVGWGRDRELAMVLVPCLRVSSADRAFTPATVLVTGSSRHAPRIDRCGPTSLRLLARGD